MKKKTLDDQFISLQCTSSNGFRQADRKLLLVASERLQRAFVNRYEPVKDKICSYTNELQNNNNRPVQIKCQGFWKCGCFSM